MGKMIKKIDFICSDPDLKKIVFAQGYYSSRIADQAKATFIWISIQQYPVDIWRS